MIKSRIFIIRLHILVGLISLSDYYFYKGLTSLNLCGTYCHKSGTRPPSCIMPQQLTIYLPHFHFATVVKWFKRWALSYTNSINLSGQLLRSDCFFQSNQFSAQFSAPCKLRAKSVKWHQLKICILCFCKMTEKKIWKWKVLESAN